MNEKQVLVDISGRTAFITLNRPEKRNAMSPSLINELYNTFSELEENDNIKTIVLKAAGKIFSAGADLSYLQKLQSFSYDENLEDSRGLMRLYQKMNTNKKIIIAMVTGHAIAGGCGLATVCDFIFAVPEAKFGYTETKIGFVPALVMVYLLRKIGESRAKPLLISGELITAEEAHRIGIVFEITPSDKIENRVREFAENLNQSVSGQSVAIVKEMMSVVQGMEINAGLEFASQMNAKARAKDDCKKGIEKFLNKEKIQW